MPARGPLPPLMVLCWLAVGVARVWRVCGAEVGGGACGDVV